MIDPTHLARLDAQIARLRTRLDAITARQQRDRETVAHTGYDVGGIRTPGGRRAAAQGMERTISLAAEAVTLARELDLRRRQRESYAAGRTDRQGRVIESREEMVRYIVWCEARLLTGKSGERDLTSEERAAVKDMLRTYKRKLRRMDKKGKGR